MSNPKYLFVSLVFGLFGSLGLLVFYYLVLGLLAKDWQYPLIQFSSFKYWMSLLILGFGIQIGLFKYLRLKNAQTKTGALTSVNTGISAFTMVSCCAHHLTEMVPILGLTVLSAFIVQYQVEFLVLGVFSNIAGIIVMLKRVKGDACQT